MTAAEAWNREYSRRGIPSSYRDEPSGALLWALANWRRMTGQACPQTALDVGCGAGRNACHLASLGARVVGIDFSTAAIEGAAARAAGLSHRPDFLLADAARGLCFCAAQFALVSDIFVYKHLVDPAARSLYRREAARVLAPGGRFLLSLAEAGDGYYGSCPDLGRSTRPRVVLDPVPQIASVIFTFEELIEELSDVFELEMAWRREKPGLMHGCEYLRRTVAAIWRVRL